MAVYDGAHHVAVFRSARRGRPGRVDKGVGDAPEGADHDYGRKLAAFGDFLKVEDAFCIADGRAAEFKDSHRDVVRFMMMVKIEN